MKTTVDEQGRVIKVVRTEGGMETTTITTYLGPRILTSESAFAQPGKPASPPQRNRWTYNELGKLTDFEGGRGDLSKLIILISSGTSKAVSRASNTIKALRIDCKATRSSGIPPMAEPPWKRTTMEAGRLSDPSGRL